MFSLKKTAIATTVAMMGLASAHAAPFFGGTSDASLITVGVSNVNAGTVHQSGFAGIGLGASPMRVDFKGLAMQPFLNNGVYHIGNAHGGGMGKFSFAKVGTQDVWFGEWTKQDTGSTVMKNAVYYVGDTAGTTLPTSGTVTYNILGINGYEANNQNNFVGTLQADFDLNLVAFAMERSIGNKKFEAVMSDGVAIAPNTAQFSGNAIIADIDKNLSVLDPNVIVTHNGTTEGRFYGAGAVGVAGIATFTDPDKNTAFGGTKVEPSN